MPTYFTSLKGKFCFEVFSFVFLSSSQIFAKMMAGGLSCALLELSLANTDKFCKRIQNYAVISAMQ